MSGSTSEGPGVAHWDGKSWAHFVTSARLTNTPPPVGERDVALNDIWASKPTVVAAGGVPAITNQPAPITLTSTAATTINFQWTDSNPCRPGVCFTVCGPSRLRCFARSLCTQPVAEGLFAGGSHYRVSIAAEPASMLEQLVLQVTPLSSPDCNPYDELGSGAAIGSSIEVGVTMIVPVVSGSGGGAGGGGGTGGGGGGSSGLCAHWSCGGSSQCATVMGGPSGVQCLFESGQSCQQWCQKYIPGNCTCRYAQRPYWTRAAAAKTGR